MITTNTAEIQKLLQTVGVDFEMLTIEELSTLYDMKAERLDQLVKVLRVAVAVLVQSLEEIDNIDSTIRKLGDDLDALQENKNAHQRGNSDGL